ncbi:MAG: hypothetical protein ACK5P5_00580 [Pseudobdellovibrionaceae bacterium]|jgi:hypothetical protein
MDFIILRHGVLLRKLFLLTVLFSMSCTNQPKIDSRVNLISSSEYMNIIDEYSDRKQVFSGLQNTIDLNGTLINSKVAFAQLGYKAKVYFWEKEKYDIEYKKVDGELKKQVQVFLSFYTPERRHNELIKSKDLWKIFLDVNGKRYEAQKPVKIKQLISEIRSMYHYHTQFSTPYMLTFELNTYEVENFPSKLTVTGPVASASIDFPALAK